MKKVLLIAVSVLLASTVLLASSCSETTADEIRIGFIGPMTGDYANYGLLQSQAVAMAIDERNAQNPIEGVSFRLIIEDSEGDVARGQAAIEKLASVDKITGLIGGVFSGVTLAITPRTQAEKILTISGSATAPGVTDIGDYIFRTVATDSLQGIVSAQYAYKEMGVRKVAVLFTRNDYSQGLAEIFQEEFTKLGGEIVALESGMQGDKDFRTQLTTIRAAQPDVLFLPNYVAEIAQILKQADELGIDAQILASDGFNNPQIFDLAGELSNGVIFSDSEMQTSDDFRKAYNSRFGDDPDGFSFNAYDGANIMMDAIVNAWEQASDADKAALKLDRKMIREYVANVKDYPGVSGAISFFPNGDVIRNIGINTVENLEYKEVGVYSIKGSELVQIR